MAEIIGGLSVSCPKCGASGVENVHRHVKWVNAYGASIRVFCHNCGQVTDKRVVRGVESVEVQNWNAKINRQKRGSAGNG